MSATLVIAKGHYISRVWFFSQPGGDMDVLAVLDRDLPKEGKPAGPWTFKYRFRYYNDEHAHGSADRKSGYEGTFGSEHTEAELWEMLEQILHLMVTRLFPPGFKVDVTDVQTDEPQAVIHIIRQKPYMHMKLVETPS